MVMSIASRGLAPPWNIWADFSDVITMRDSGWMIQLLSDHQEIYDSTLMAFKIAEDPEVMLPIMTAFGGFILSHTSKPVDLYEQSLIDEFLPEVPEKGWEHIFMDPDRPMMHGNLIMPNAYPGYQEFRMKIQLAHLKAKEKIKEVTLEFKKKFGRDYGNGLVQEYKCSDAEFIMINAGVYAKQMESVIDKLRQEGIKAGILRLRTYRPFPVTEIVESVKNAKIIGVIDRNTAFGSPTGGAISSDVRASLQNDKRTRNLSVIPFINGLGGRDVTQQQQMEQIKLVIEAYEKGELPKTDELMGSTTYWTGSMGG